MTAERDADVIRRLTDERDAAVRALREMIDAHGVGNVAAYHARSVLAQIDKAAMRHQLGAEARVDFSAGLEPAATEEGSTNPPRTGEPKERGK